MLHLQSGSRCPISKIPFVGCYRAIYVAGRCGTEARGLTSADGGRADDTALRDLAVLAGEAVEGVTAKVTYRVTMEVEGETLEGEWVIVRRPPDSRIEFSGMVGGEEIAIVIIEAGGTSYLCFSSGGDESCLATGETAAETAAIAPLFDVPRGIAEEIEDVGLVDRSQRTIAGVNATCFTVSGALAGLGEGEICFSDEGLLLFLQSEVGGTSSTFEATSVSRDVTDADFEPPYELSELPDFEIPTPSLP